MVSTLSIVPGIRLGFLDTEPGGYSQERNHVGFLLRVEYMHPGSRSWFFINKPITPCAQDRVKAATRYYW